MKNSSLLSFSMDIGGLDVIVERIWMSLRHVRHFENLIVGRKGLLLRSSKKFLKGHFFVIMYVEREQEMGGSF